MRVRFGSLPTDNPDGRPLDAWRGNRPIGRSMSRHLMLVPSLACPAGCAYCFGPHAGGKTMSRDTLHKVVDWLQALGAGAGDAGEPELAITFHGGEPLVPGARWYREALPLLRDGLAPRTVRFAAQSNLWLLTDELCELFREYGVSLGTSLDGPEAINDAQRGPGYFAKTMAGIERARAHGIEVGAICTFTARSAPYAREIFDFFVGQGLNFSVHAALPSLRRPEADVERRLAPDVRPPKADAERRLAADVRPPKADAWSIEPEVHGELLVDLLDRYLDGPTRVRIGTLDSMAQSVSAGRGGICTFGECLGGYLAVGPDGSIYPCQRFAGMPGFAVGDVAARPSLDELGTSIAWREFRAREEALAAESGECGGCAYRAHCRGGCPYNALVSNGGSFGADRRDPHCAAYRRAFDAITERALAELFSPENLDAVLDRPDPERGLMRRGPLLSIMRPAQPTPIAPPGCSRETALCRFSDRPMSSSSRPVGTSPG
jgi:uncharacterized protein